MGSLSAHTCKLFYCIAPSWYTCIRPLVNRHASSASLLRPHCLHLHACYAYISGPYRLCKLHTCTHYTASSQCGHACTPTVRSTSRLANMHALRVIITSSPSPCGHACQLTVRNQLFNPRAGFASCQHAAALPPAFWRPIKWQGPHAPVTDRPSWCQWSATSGWPWRQGQEYGEGQEQKRSGAAAGKEG